MRTIFVTLLILNLISGHAHELCEEFNLQKTINLPNIKYGQDSARFYDRSVDHFHFGREGSVRIPNSTEPEQLILYLPDLNVREGEAQSWRARSQIVIYAKEPQKYTEGETLYFFPSEIFRVSQNDIENGVWISIFEIWLGRNWIAPEKSFRITVYLTSLPTTPTMHSDENQTELSIILVGQQFDAISNRWLDPSWKFDAQNSLRIKPKDILKLNYVVQRPSITSESLGSFIFSSHAKVDPIKNNRAIKYKLPSISTSIRGSIRPSDYYIDGVVPAKFYTNKKGWIALDSAYHSSTPNIRILNFSTQICH